MDTSSSLVPVTSPTMINHNQFQWRFTLFQYALYTFCYILFWIINRDYYWISQHFFISFLTTYLQLCEQMSFRRIESTLKATFCYALIYLHQNIGSCPAKESYGDMEYHNSLDNNTMVPIPWHHFFLKYIYLNVTHHDIELLYPFANLYL